MASTLKKRPCSICRRWFVPDARAGKRQRACSKDCQAALRKRTQAAWRKRNPDYGFAWRLQAHASDEEGGPPRVPRPLDRLPWDLAKDEFGTQGAGIIEGLGRLLVRHAKDEMRSQGGDITSESPRVPLVTPKAEIPSVAG